MSVSWLDNDLWRAHVSWLTPTWVGSTKDGRRDFNAGQWLDKLQSAHYQTLIFYIKHHDGYCTYPSKYNQAKPERDFFGECAAEAHKRGMRILAYYSSVLDQVTAGENTDWRVVGRDGNLAEGWFNDLWPESYCCINNPGYRAFMLGQLAELRDNYNPDGFWLDIFSPHTESNCFCKFCKSKYFEENNGQSIFDTCDSLWYQKCFVTLIIEIKNLVKEKNPDCFITYNAGIRIPGVDNHVDFFTHEAVNAINISMICRSMRSCGKPFEVTYRLYTAVGSWAMRSYNRVLLESATIAAHGGACSIEVPPTYSGRILNEPVKRVTEVGEYIRKREPYFTGTRPVYDAGIFIPDSLYCKQTDGWGTAFLERDIPFAWIYHDSDLSQYRLLVLDNVDIIDEKLAHRLEDYVYHGGNLIVECNAVGYDKGGYKILSKILGIDIKGKTGHNAHYLSRLDDGIKTDLGEDDIVINGEAYDVSLGKAVPLAYYRYQFAEYVPGKNIIGNLPPSAIDSDDPVITINGYGAGRALYIACPLGNVEISVHKNIADGAREFPVQLAANLAHLMIGEYLLRSTTPAGVEVVVNSRNGCHIIHLLNNYIYGQYCDNRRDMLTLADVPVCVNENRVGCVKRAFRVSTDGKERELEISRDGQWIQVNIQRLGIHEIIVLEHGG